MNLPMSLAINHLYHYYFLKRLDDLLGTSFSKPSFVSLGISSRCNSLCKMCPIPNRHFKKEMTTDQIKELLTELKKWLGPFILIFASGEPTLREDIWEIISFADSLKIRTILSTNGTLITKKNIHLLKNSGLKQIAISLDSLNPITYKKIRGVDFHKKVLQTIMILKEYTKNIGISINTVITKYNINELPKLIEFTKQKKINSIAMIPLVSCDRGDVRKELKHIWPDPKKIETSINQIIRYKKNSYPVSNSITHLELIKKYYNSPNLINEKCQINSVLFIQANGDLQICPKRVGNVLKKPPKEIWNSKEGKQLRKQILKCRKDCAVNQCGSVTYNSLINRIKQFKRITTFD